MDGEFKEQAFGILRPIRNPQAFPFQTREYIQQAVKEFDYASIQLPYQLVLCVMPLNFIEFWKLIWNRKASTQLTAKHNLPLPYKGLP